MHYALLKWRRVSLTTVDWDDRLHTNKYQNDRKVGRRSQGKTANTASIQKEIPSLSHPSSILDLLHCNAENGCKVEDDIPEKKSREQNHQHWRVFKRMRSNKCSGEFDRARWKSLLEKEHQCDNGLGEKSNIPIPPDSNSWINLHLGWSVLPGRRPESGGQQWIISNQLEGGVQVPTSGLQIQKKYPRTSTAASSFFPFDTQARCREVHLLLERYCF